MHALGLLLHLSWRQMDMQARLLPNQICLLLLQPVPALVCNFDFEVPHQASEYEAHFGISKTITSQQCTTLRIAGPTSWRDSYEGRRKTDKIRLCDRLRILTSCPRSASVREGIHLGASNCARRGRSLCDASSEQSAHGSSDFGCGRQDRLTYVARHPVAENGVPLWRRHSPHGIRPRWIIPQCLSDDGIQVTELGSTSHVDLVLGGESGMKLLNDFGSYIGIGCKHKD